MWGLGRLTLITITEQTGPDTALQFILHHHKVQQLAGPGRMTHYSEGKDMGNNGCTDQPVDHDRLCELFKLFFRI